MLGDRKRPFERGPKGFLPHEGHLEHSFVLHRVLESARASKEEVVVAWLDLADAFGSVPHAVIRRALIDADVPARVVDTVASLYQGSTVTEAIPMLSGVRQGCPLNPIFFDLVIEPLVRSAEESVAGFEVYGEKVIALAYADDFALIAADPNSMGRFLRAAKVSARALGLSFNFRKCATLHLGAKGQPIPTPFQLADEHLPVLEHGAGAPTSTLESPRESEPTKLPTAPPIN